MEDRTGQHIGSYRLVHLLGRGGYTEVYLGQHLRLNQVAKIDTQNPERFPLSTNHRYSGDRQRGSIQSSVNMKKPSQDLYFVSLDFSSVAHFDL